MKRITLVCFNLVISRSSKQTSVFNVLKLHNKHKLHYQGHKKTLNTDFINFVYIHKKYIVYKSIYQVEVCDKYVKFGKYSKF